MRKERIHTLLRLVITGVLLHQTAAVSATTPEQKSVKVNGVDMQYVEQGSGQTLILLHGFTSDMRTWKAMIPRLAKDFRVIAPIQRYFGKGDWSKDWPPFNRDLLADDVAGLIQALGGKPVHLVGWSMGGTVAYIAALRYPRLIRSAYLYEGTARMQLDANTLQRDAAQDQKIWAPVIKIMKEQGLQGAIGLFINAVSGDPGACERLPDAKRVMYRDNARILQFAGRKSAPKAMSCEEIKTSQVPTRYVFGTASIEPFQRRLNRFQACVGKSSFEIIEGATHAWPRLDPDAFVNSVTAFARQVD